MNFLVFTVALFQTSSGLSISGFNGLSQRLEKTHKGKWMIFKDERSTDGQINQQNNLREEVLAVYEFNHQECDMVLKPRRRRRVKCHDEIPNHGRYIGLFRPFITAEKWLHHRRKLGSLETRIHGTKLVEPELGP